MIYLERSDKSAGFEGVTIMEKKKNLVDKITYAYIRKIKKWMFCPNCKEGKMSINKKSTLWQCEFCGYNLGADEFEDDYVFWFCDECDSYLNNQEGFDRNATRHVCTSCGYENDITFDNIKGICSDCGKVILDQDATLCADCRIIRKEKTVENLKKVGKGVLAAGAFIGAVAVAAQANGTSSDDNSDWSYLPNDDFGYDGKRCANCGNTDENTLWDEGDTIYCSKCCHRTRVDDGADDLVECPYCHRMRDRKAMYCRWCNDSTWQASTKEEFEETDKILKDMGY